MSADFPITWEHVTEILHLFVQNGYLRPRHIFPFVESMWLLPEIFDIRSPVFTSSWFVLICSWPAYSDPKIISNPQKGWDCHRNSWPKLQMFLNFYLRLWDIFPSAESMWLLQKFLTQASTVLEFLPQALGHFPICRKHVTVTGNSWPLLAGPRWLVTHLLSLSRAKTETQKLLSPVHSTLWTTLECIS